MENLQLSNQGSCHYNGANGNVNCRTQVKSICDELLQCFQDEMQIRAMTNLLREYQPTQVTLYEVERCRYTLQHVDSLDCYLQHKINKIVCVFLPSNLPLYSALLFVIMPALVSRTVVVRPNTALIGQGVVQKLLSILHIPRLLPNIQVFYGSREEFKKLHLSIADLIIFTGRNETRDEIKKCMKPGSYLINNGSGHNPIVVSEDADIETCTNDILYARFFNAGQDCAGPDAVFVHDKLINEFLNCIREKVTRRLVMEKEHNDEEEEVMEYYTLAEDERQPVWLQGTAEQLQEYIVVAKLHRVEELQRLQSILDNFKRNVICGGNVDMIKKIVYPTIILEDMKGKGNVNFTEVFGPILFLYVFHDDKELQEYFQNPRYMQNKMYVSLYGTSGYIQKRNDEELIKIKGSAKGGVGILLHNKIIHDINVDNGTQPYGGYSKGASSILHVGENLAVASVALPILIPKVMFQLFVQHIPIQHLTRNENSSTATAVSTTAVLRPNEKEGKVLKQKIATEVIAMVKSTFEANTTFAFAFGSVTEDKYSLKDNGVCTYVCTKERNLHQCNRFSQMIENFHNSHGFEFDRQYISEIITCNELRYITHQLYYQLCGINYNPWLDERPLNGSFLTEFKCHDEMTHGATFMVAVLAEKAKFALTCMDKSFMQEVVQEAKQVTELIRREILRNLRRTFEQDKVIPQILRLRYPKSTAEEIVAKLETLSCCEILRHVEWMRPELRTYKQTF